MKQTKKENPAPVEQAQPARSARAKVKYVRIAPRKLRGVINTIRYKHPEQAFRILMTLKQKGARITEKLLKTAVANAKVLQMDENRLVISDIRADGGPVMKRFLERSMGRGDRIIKRTSHLSIILNEGQKTRGISSAAPVAQEEKKETKSGKKFQFGSGRKKAAAGSK